MRHSKDRNHGQGLSHASVLPLPVIQSRCKANLSRFPHRQAGYASVLFLAIFAAIGLAVFSLYDSGVVATERVRLQNTADNVAYSTATMITRDMNVIAITNRAMVANQKKRGQPDLFVFLAL